MSVPAYGYINNSLPIKINATFNNNGALTYHSFEYGGSLLYDYVLSSYTAAAVPVITSTPSDVTVEVGYTGQSISWTATDTNPDTYTIELQGTGTVAGPAAWDSGVAITFNVPDGLAVGNYTYEITITDDFDHDITDTVVFTVEEAPPAPPPADIPGYDLPIALGISSITIIGLIVLMKKRKK